MASSYSGKLRLEKQGIGENENTWGTILNTQIDLIDDAIAGFVSIDMTSGGDLTLSESNGISDESRNAVLVLTGTPTSNVQLVLPNTGKNYIIRNKITNSASVRPTPTGGTGIKIPSDFVGLIHSDGATAYEVGRQMDPSALVSAALRDDLTSIRTELETVSKAIAGSVARLDADNDFEHNVITGYRVSTETTVGNYTPVSADTGRTLVFFVSEGGTSVNHSLNLTKTLPVGWNMTILNLSASVGVVTVSAGASVSLINTSGHAALNNYGSGAVVQIVRQEGSNSHAWAFFQGETQT